MGPLAEIDEGPDGKIIKWGAAAESLYGYGADEMLGVSIEVLFPAGFPAWHQPLLARAFRGESIAKKETVHGAKDGRYLRIQYSLEPRRDAGGRVLGVRTVVHAAQESEAAQAAVDESDTWIRGIVEVAPDGIVSISETGIINYANPAAERMFGHGPGEVLGKSVNIFMPPPYSDQHDQFIENYLATGTRRILGLGREVEGLHKDGTVFPIHIYVSEVRLDSQRIFTAIIRDISQEKLAQSEKDRLLMELQERNKKITCLYSVGEVIRSNKVETDLLQEVVRLIRPACYQPEIARARIRFDDERYVDAAFDETPWSVSEDIVAGGRKRGCIDIYYLEEQSGPDTHKFLEEDRNLIESIAYTLGESVERREAEALVMQASKLASIGELAAGVGHEINNPINGIINCVDILLGKLGPGSKEREFAQFIGSEADRIAVIVKNLMTFSRQDREQHSPARMHDIVEAVLSLCGKKIAKSHIDLRVDVPKDLPPVNCRSEQMQQVLMNLILNAVYALNERYPEHDPDKILAIRADTASKNARSYLRLAVEDHGIGIKPSHMMRLFDPFFTTKGRDKGTGLGLSVSDGIVKDHGGHIYVECDAGKRTSFQVHLPLEQKSPSGGQATQGERA